MLKNFITVLENSGFLVEDEGEVFGLYFVILDEQVIELNKKYFPIYKTENEKNKSSKTISDFEEILKNYITEVNYANN